MSRSRNIKPGFFKNDLLVELPFEYRLLFIGLWTVADREGKCEDRPKKIKMEVFPADDVDVSAGLAALESAGFIERYEVDGGMYLRILAWAKHQAPHVRESASVIPDPVPCAAKEAPMHNLGSADALPRSPDSLIPDSLIPQEKQEHVQPAAAPSRFAEFWAVYPNPKAKKVARAIWARRKLDSRCDELIAHVRLMLANDDSWLRGFIPMASTYLNQDRWEDIPQQAARAGPQSAQQPPSKTLSAIQTLQAMKHGNVDPRRDSGRPEQAHVLELGQDAGGGHDRGHRYGVG